LKQCRPASASNRFALKQSRFTPKQYRFERVGRGSPLPAASC
jgi:hypothetical protein